MPITRRFAVSIAFLSMAAMAAPNDPLPVIPGETLALYRFDDGSGTAVMDATDGHNGALVGAVTPGWVAGMSGGALEFADSTAIVTLGYPIPLPASWTLQAWTRFPLAVTLPTSAGGSGGWRTLVQFGALHHHVLVNVDGELGVFNNGFSPCGYNVSSLAGWQLLTAVGSGTRTDFYIGGTFVGFSPNKETRDIKYIGNYFYGGDGEAQNWGTIDCLRILNVARSAADIALDADSTPLTPGNFAQSDLDGTPVGPGGSVHDGFIVQATVTQPQGLPVRLRVEVKPAGVAFDGTTDLSEGAEVPSGSVASVQVSGHSPGVFRWRAWALNSAGVASPAVCYGSNPDDLDEVDIRFVNAAPSAAPGVQLRGSDGARIIDGDRIYDAEGVRFTAQVDDPDLDFLRLRVEVQRVGLPFSNRHTLESGVVASGSAATCDMTFDKGAYRWQHCAVDSKGGVSAWIPHGTGAADFEVAWMGSTSAGSGCAGSAGHDGVTVMAALLAIGAAFVPRFTFRVARVPGPRS